MMYVFGSIPRLLHVRATSTAGCSPRDSAIAGCASAVSTKAAASERTVLAFIARLLEAFINQWLQYHCAQGGDKRAEREITVRERGQWTDCSNCRPLLALSSW